MSQTTISVPEKLRPRLVRAKGKAQLLCEENLTWGEFFEILLERAELNLENKGEKP